MEKPNHFPPILADQALLEIDWPSANGGAKCPEKRTLQKSLVVR